MILYLMFNSAWRSPNHQAQNQPQQQQYGAPPAQQQQYNQGYGQDQYQQQYQQPPQQANYPPPQAAYAPPPSQHQQQYSQQPPPPSQSYAMQPTGAAPTPGGPVDMQNFFTEVGSIQDQLKQLSHNVNLISELHARRLATTDDAQIAQSTSQLTQLTSQTSALTNSIRGQITSLNNANRASPQGDEGFKTRKGQIQTLQNGFKKGLQEYQDVEKRSRDKYRQRVERQVRIVKPDATQEEIKAAFDEAPGGQQIFSQALVQSRTQGARAAFQEVQARNQDLRKIEETITQLAQMMQDMATLVLEQDESVRQIETSAVGANQDVEAGLDQTKKAVKSARRARKMRWICFVIILVILAVIAIALAVHFTKK